MIARIHYFELVRCDFDNCKSEAKSVQKHDLYVIPSDWLAVQINSRMYHICPVCSKEKWFTIKNLLNYIISFGKMDGVKESDKKEIYQAPNVIEEISLPIYTDVKVAEEMLDEAISHGIRKPF